jgi:hypothetical protein
MKWREKTAKGGAPYFVLLTQYCWDDRIKEDEMGGACSVHGVMRYAYRIFIGKPEGKKPLGILGVDGRIILKWILWKKGLEWIHMGKDRDLWRAFVNMVMNLRVPRRGIS